MKTYWAVIEKDGRQLEIELEGELYGGEFRVKKGIVRAINNWYVTEDDFNWVVDELVNKGNLFEVFDEKVRSEGNGDVLDVSLL